MDAPPCGTRHDAVLDVWLTVLLAVSAVGSAVLVTILVPAGAHRPALLAAVTAVQLLASGTLLVRRRAPVVVATALTAAALAVEAAVAVTGPARLLSSYHGGDFWVPVALSAVGSILVLAEADRRRVGLVWVLVGLTAAVSVRPWQPSLGGLLHTALPALIGMCAGSRSRLLQALRDRAARAEREQVLLAEQARADERAQLAAEMHDVVSHRVSLMVLQAGA